MLKRLLAFIIGIVIIASGMQVLAAGPVFDLTAEAAILVEQTTGRQLYGKNEHKRMYPASMTKILTALVALDYLEPDEFIILGEELRETPANSSIAYLEPGETILMEHLLRGLLIMSGNEAGCAIAYNTAKRIKGVADIDYDEAEKLFSDLMNIKAAELGALDTHFTNPHGFHDENHYSTAYDIALFSRAFLEVPLLAKIVAETTFTGNSAGDEPPEGALTLEHSWLTHNKLIMDSEEGYYTYANGIKTGFTDEAGNCIAASAEKDGVKLISVVFFSPEPGVWVDSKTMMEYGFNNYSFFDVQKSNELLEQAVIGRPRLGEPALLDVLSKGSFRDFYSKEEIRRIKRKIVYDESFLDKPDNDVTLGAAVLKPPIMKGDVLGKVSYYLDGQVIYTDDAIAAADTYKRTLGSDLNYYLNLVKKNLFNKSAVPYWIGGAAILAAFIIILTVRHRKRKRNQRFSMYRRRRWN